MFNTPSHVSILMFIMSNLMNELFNLPFSIVIVNISTTCSSVEIYEVEMILSCTFFF